MSDRDEERDAEGVTQPDNGKKKEKKDAARREGDTRPPYAERWERQGRRSCDDRPAYGRDKRREGGNDRSDRPRFQDRGERRPRESREECRPFPSRTDRKPWQNRDEHRSREERGERRPFGERQSRGERRPYESHQDRGERKPYENRRNRGESRPYEHREERGPFPSRDDSKPWRKRDEQQPEGFRPADGDRPPFERDPRPPRHDGPHPRDLAAIRDLDEDILRLIMRRARLLRKIGSKGRVSPETEKLLRLSWEQKAAHLSRDSRLARDMFVLLQAVDPLSRVEEDQAFFNLAPSRQPVAVDLPAPSDPQETRCWMALAAASGKPLALSGVTLSSDLIDCLKALNQLGGQLRWEEDGSVGNKESKGLLPGMDKVIHVGGEAFSFWLVLALSLGRLSRLKITGSQELRFLNLAPLRHFLPQLGVRLTNVIPAQDGLPVRVECSGMVPAEMDLPEGLPAGFIAALALAAPFRERDSVLRLPGDLPADNSALLAALAILRQCGQKVRHEGRILEIRRAPLSFPESPALHMDLPMTASLLALPALAGGSVRLAGVWPESGPGRDLARALLDAAGLEVHIAPDHVSSSKPEGSVSAAPGPDLIRALRDAAPALLPLGALLAAAAALAGSRPVLAAPESLSRGEAHALEGFLSQLSLEMDAEGVLTCPENAVPAASWLSPDASWAVALAWAAFLRPNLRLVNPDILTGVYPKFWNFYNSLPNPDLNRKAETEPEDDKPARRRIIAAGVFGKLPDLPPADDDFRA